MRSFSNEKQFYVRNLDEKNCKLKRTLKVSRCQEKKISWNQFTVEVQNNEMIMN